MVLILEMVITVVVSMVAVMAVVLGLLLQAMMALGLSSVDGFLVYVLGLLFLLALGATNFVFLLLPDKSAV